MNREDITTIELPTVIVSIQDWLNNSGWTKGAIAEDIMYCINNKLNELNNKEINIDDNTKRLEFEVILNIKKSKEEFSF
jgi:hypothetical protein